MKQLIKRMLKDAGYTGRINFRRSDQFGTPDDFGPAIHRRWIDPTYETEEIMYSVDRDGFSAVVIYIEPASYYRHRANLENPKHVWDKQQINGLRKGLGYCGSWSKPAKEYLHEELQRNNYAFKISKEQSKFGIEWLKRTQFKLNGESFDYSCSPMGGFGAAYEVV